MKSPSAVNPVSSHVSVEPEITTNDMALMIKLAAAGAGITFGMEESFRAPIDRANSFLSSRTSARASPDSISTIRAAGILPRSCAR